MLKLLCQNGENDAALAGRVIYRTKEDVADWNGAPLFPRRNVREPVVVDLGPEHRAWLEQIQDLFSQDSSETGQAQRRAAGWRALQALQWATSSVEAGLGYLVRQAPQYLVSSRAGGEGFNLQVAHRLVHVDVPWNPMELEQRVGRIHRFGSREMIIVDTLVVKDSREADAYRIAAAKLKEIAATMVAPDRFDELFSRVMALVPPTELEAVMGARAISPFTDDEQRRLGELVREGFERWQSFDERYKGSRLQIKELDAGQATWDDLRAFAEEQMGAKAADGFAVLGFKWENGEVLAASRSANVLDIAGRFFACGDFRGMPVTRGDSTRAESFGLNIALTAEVLRRAGLPQASSGAAHLRWPENHPVPLAGMERPFGALVFCRQSLRFEGGIAQEEEVALLTFVIGHSSTHELVGEERAAFVRELLESTIRREPERDPQLLARLRTEECRLLGDLRIPSESDRSKGIRFSVIPLLAASVA